MSNWLRESIQWLADQQDSATGESITYKRGAKSATLTAVIGRTPFRQSDGVGRSTLTYSECDFLIQTASLRFGTTAFTPERGDRIEWDGGVYEVSAPGGEPCFRTSDSFGVRARVHTKRVE